MCQLVLSVFKNIADITVNGSLRNLLISLIRVCSILLSHTDLIFPLSGSVAGLQVPNLHST